MERKAIFSYDSEPWDKTDYTVLIPVELLSFCNIEFFIFTAGEIKNRLKLMVVVLLLLESCLLGISGNVCVCGTCIYIFKLNKSVTESGLTVSSRVFIAADRLISLVQTGRSLFGKKAADQLTSV